VPGYQKLQITASLDLAQDAFFTAVPIWQQWASKG